ncbi:MAG: hypothetical protein C4306_11600, partial [Thermoleophilia bacterium]
ARVAVAPGGRLDRELRELRQDLLDVDPSPAQEIERDRLVLGHGGSLTQGAAARYRFRFRFN